MTRFIAAIRLAGSFLLIAVTLLMATDAGLRYIFRAPIVGAQDLLSTGLLLVFCLGLADSWLARSHVRMDLAYDTMPRFMRIAVDVVSLVVAELLALALAYGGYVAFGKFSSYGAATPLLGIPYAFLAAVVIFGAFCFALAVLYDGYLRLSRRAAPQPPTSAAA